MFTSLLLTAALAPGQPPAPYYPNSVRAAAQPPATLPMTAPTTPADPMPQTGNGNGATNGNGNGASGPPGNPDTAESIKTDKEEPPAPTKYLLERSLAGTSLGELLTDRGITVYGWTAMSYNVSSASGSNLPRTLDDRANEFLLNQNYLHVEKTIDTSKKEFQLGWVSETILPGSDYRYTVPRGLFNRQLTSNNGGPQLYGFDPYQFYVQAFLPGFGPQGTKVIVGRFNTHISYEVVQQVDVPFVSRSYLFQYNPFTHTGVWATTVLNDTWTASYGASTGNDTFIDPANRFTFLGQLKWAPKDGKTTVLFNTSISDGDFNARENFAFYNYYGFVVTHKFTDKLTYALDTGYSHVKDVPNIGFADWYGAVNYFIYAHTDTVSSTLRAEVFNDPTGFRTGSKGLYTEATYGVAWKPTPGLIIRPSVRYDNNSRTGAYEGSQNLYTATLEAIIRW